MKFASYATLAAAMIPAVSAVCPGDTPCSGQGQCGAHDKCSCNRGFIAADCSQRACPSKLSFADIQPAGMPHQYHECSGKGMCDRKTGECECYQGFSGAGCERMDCPNDCSEKGHCVSIGSEHSGYAAWDAGKIMVCKCDAGFSGPDCSGRMCPTGDDPLTTGQVAEVHRVQFVDASTAIASGQFSLTYTDSNQREFTTWAIDIATATRYTVTEALQALPNSVIPSVTVTEGGALTDAGGIYWDVTFSDPVNSGTQNLLVIDSEQCRDGCQPVIETTVTGGGAITETVTRQTTGTSENAICGTRGVCNGETGSCECFAGYTGEACGQQTSST